MFEVIKYDESHESTVAGRPTHSMQNKKNLHPDTFLYDSKKHQRS